MGLIVGGNMFKPDPVQGEVDKAVAKHNERTQKYGLKRTAELEAEDANGPAHRGPGRPRKDESL